MEVVIPLFALSSLYLINNQNQSNTQNIQNKKKMIQTETFINQNKLPNTNIPDKNYPEQYPISSETDETSELSTVNKYDNAGGVYTDQYFNPNINSNVSTNNTNIPPILQTTDNLEYYSLTGDKVDGTYFTHNNMVPFFGSKMHGEHTTTNRNESILDSYSGAGSQIIIKKEQAPLFEPHKSLQWANGAPNQTDFIKSRINPSARMANVNPFAEKTVAPGLDLGYTTEGAGGFNSGMMAREKWLDKNVDQLRVDSKPRASEFSLYGLEGAPTTHVKYNPNVEQMGVFEKHLPDQSFELSEDRYFTTTGILKGETLHAMPVDRYVSRPETTMEYSGVAGSQNSSSYLPGEYLPSHNQQLGETQLGPANANGRQYANDGDYGIKSKKAYPNNRTENYQDNYFGSVKSSIGASIAPLLDILRPSRRQNVVGTLRPYQNPGSTVTQSYIFNPADKLNTTIRETTENSQFHLNVNSNQNGGAYKVTNQQPVNTYREETSTSYIGGASASERTRQLTSYEANYNQNNNNIKSSTIDGYMVKGNMSLMNGDINMRQDNRDELLRMNREVAPDMPYQTPDTASIGRVSGSSNALYSEMESDRNSIDISKILNSNPYVVNYKNIL
jgi:hypothetical protein